MELVLGEPVGRFLERLPMETLTESVPGKHYHLHIETDGIYGNKEELAGMLVNGLWENFRAKVKYMRIGDYNIDIQLEGSPFAWSALIPWIPSIIGLIGVAVTLIAVYGIISAIPSWAWATLGIGLGLLFFGPTIAGFFTVKKR